MRSTTLRIRRLLSLLPLLVIFLLAACVQTVPAAPAAGDSTATSSEATTEISSESAPAATGRGVGDTLRLLWWQAPTILNPHLSTGGKDQDASRVVYEPLASYDREGNLVLFLADQVPSLENGDVAADGLSVTWRLKPDVVWSDGEPFTADDVKFTFDYLSNPETGATTLSNYSAVESVEVVDPLTVRVNFKEVTPAWSIPFTGAVGQIIPRHIFEEYSGANAATAPANLAPVGTGPYQLVEFRPGDTVIYEPNPNFREEDKPYFSRVEIKGGGDATSAARAVLQTGEGDFAWGLFVEAAVLEQLLQGGQGRLVLNPGSTGELILLNQSDPYTEIDGEASKLGTQHPFLTDPLVREAIALSIDRQTIVDSLFGIAGVPTSNILLAPQNVVSPNTSWEYNLEKAAALLDEAGWVDSDGDGVREKDGISLHILYQTTVNPQRQKVQEVIKQALESIGFSVELKSIDGTVFFSNDASNPDTWKHFYSDVQMYTTGSFSPDPSAFLKSWTSDQVPQLANGFAGGNDVRWISPEYDALYAQAIQELDPEHRRELFIELNDLLVNSHVVIPLIHRTAITAASNSLQGVELSPWESNLWLLKDWYRSAE